MNHDLPPRWLSLDSFRPLFRGLGQRLLLIGPLGIILLIAGDWLGDDFGVPGLFWHQDMLKQALVGFAVALLFAETCLVSYLLDAPKPWLKDLPAPAPEGWRRTLSGLADVLLRLLVPQPKDGGSKTQQWRQLRWYLSVTWLPLLVVLKGMALRHFGERWGFLAGMAVALIVVGVFTWVFQHLDGAGWNERMHRVIARLPRPLITSLILAVAFVALVLLAALVPQTHTTVVILLGLWVSVAGAYAGAVRFEDAAPERRLVHGLAAASLGCFFIAYYVLLSVCLVSPVWGALLVSPAVALCLLLTLIVSGHGFLKFHFGGWYTAIAFAFVAMAIGVAGFTSYRHQLSALDYASKLLDLELADFQMEAAESGESKELLDKLKDSYGRLFKRYDALYPLMEAGQKGAINRKNLENVPQAKAEQQELRWAMKELEDKRLDRWKLALIPDKKGKPKLAIVTATGGGSRSAIWTAYTLAKLERELGAAGIQFPSHVRLISGASGGMLGASYYTATLPGPQGHAFKNDADIESFARKVGQDALTPVCQRLVFFDLPGVFVPGGTAHDRGAALEDAWKEYLDGALEKSFADLAKGEAEGWRPSLVLSPMLVEDGRRVLFSNLYLSPLTETTGSFLTADNTKAVQAAKAKQTPRPKGKFFNWPRYSVTSMEFFQMFPDAWPNFKLGTAVRVNASFPYVSPIAALPTNPPRHLVDAGYYDNYGVNLAAWWVYQNYDWLQENTSGIVVIQIRDGMSERKRVSPLTRPEDHKVWDLERGLEGIVGPLTGAGSAFQATATFRNDEQLQMLHDWFNDAPPARPFFTTVVFECQASLALSWYLSESDIADAMKGFGPGSANELAVGKLVEWFKQ